MLRIVTEVNGLTAEERSLIRLSAKAVAERGGEMGTLILPGRPELYRLDQVGRDTFRLRLTTEEEVAQAILQEARR